MPLSFFNRATLRLRPSWLLLGLVCTCACAQTRADTSVLAAAARTQIGKTVGYDPTYQRLSYPNGDVPLASGVCTDVVIRALRDALSLDLQKLVHEDMSAAFSAYPANWGLKKPDRNIDHRRVPNLQTYFKRRGWELPPGTDARDYRAGDLVTCLVPPNRPHILIVSDRTDARGEPLVIHNIGAGTREEAGLFAFKITGRYRMPVPTTPPPPAAGRG